MTGPLRRPSLFWEGVTLRSFAETCLELRERQRQPMITLIGVTRLSNGTNPNHCIASLVILSFCFLSENWQ